LSACAAAIYKATHVVGGIDDFPFDAQRRQVIDEQFINRIAMQRAADGRDDLPVTLNPRIANRPNP
jgi:hypothetical protein